MLDDKKGSLRFCQFVPGEGIFLGACILTALVDHPSSQRILLRTSRRKYLVFAAGQDLTSKQHDNNRLFSFAAAIEEVGKLDLYGHKGAAIDNERSLFKGLENGKLAGLWVVPPLQALCGYNSARNYVQPNNLFRFTHLEPLSSTIAKHPLDENRFYMSCTTYEAPKSTPAWRPQAYCLAVEVHSGNIISLATKTSYLNPEPMKRCRPFRFVPAPKHG